MKLVFLGSQGSGKSTQAKLIADKLNLPHFEMGDLLRERAKASDKIGSQIKKALDAGQLVPNEITIKILNENISKNKSKDGYVLDGYPRNSVQLAALEPDINKAFYIQVSDEEAIRRLSLRKREDDTQKILEKRLEIYHQRTEPLLENFRGKGILNEVDGERTIEEIHEDISQIVENLGS